jgi:predicted phosphoadenosine phosphosulfate sulfurtransferase
VICIFIFKKSNVYEEALLRTERIFNEFDNVIVSFSGGKDSTVVLELALIVAKKLGRLPLKVMWIDQEAEWEATANYCREVFYRDDIEPYWIQMPFRIFNSASFEQDWLHAWDPLKKADWINPQDPISIKENVFGTDRFKELFPAIAKYIFKGEKYANLGGIRTQESPMRFGGVTGALTYKDITWGKKEPTGYTFYPIYDWGFADVWTAIQKFEWKYNTIYDKMFNYGVAPKNMRVSNLHHETAYRSLYMLQELEGNTYNKLCNRLPGISTFSQMQENVLVDELPEMFGSWCEYRDYLLPNLIREDLQIHFQKRFDKQDGEHWAKEHVQEILVNDWTGTKNENAVSRMNLVRKINDDTYAKKYK